MSPIVEKLDTENLASSRPLLTRLISAAVLVPFVLIATEQGGRLFAGMVAGACIVMIFEWTRMVERVECSAAFYALSLSAAAAMFFAPGGRYAIAYGICFASGVLAFVLARRDGRLGVWPALAALYILAPTIALMWLRLDAAYGRAL
ncbi:MAG: hypothetical protein ACX939_15400, partial [Hyphococcus sp.]